MSAHLGLDRQPAEVLADHAAAGATESPSWCSRRAGRTEPIMLAYEAGLAMLRRRQSMRSSVRPGSWWFTTAET